MANNRNRRRERDIKNKNLKNEKIKWYRAIKKLVSDKRYDLALSEIISYLNTYPDDGYAKLVYGDILSATRNNAKAREVFQELVDSGDKTMYTALYHIACIEKYENNIEEAKRLFKKNIKESPYEEDLSKLSLAEIAMEEHDYEKASSYFNLLSSKHESHKQLGKSKICFIKHQYKDAFDILNTIPVNDSVSFNRKVSFQRGITLFCLHRFSQALREFESVIDGPKSRIYYEAKLEMAKVNRKLGNYDKVISMCDSLMNQNEKTNCEIYMLLGKTYQSKKEDDKALEFYKKMLLNDEYKDRAYYEIGKFYITKREYDKALECFSKMDDSSYSNDVKFNLIIINLRKKNYNEAYNILNNIDSSTITDFEDLEVYRRLQFFVYKNMGLDITPLSYSDMQYENYSIDDAVEHIKKRHFINKKNSSTFNTDLDVYEIIDNVLPKIGDDTLDELSVSDVYTIPYDNVGYTADGDIANSVCVVTLPDTKKIITMFPVDINSTTNSKNKNGVKRLSQIEKFNKKYNLK